VRRESTTRALLLSLPLGRTPSVGATDVRTQERHNPYCGCVDRARGDRPFDDVEKETAD